MECKGSIVLKMRKLEQSPGLISGQAHSLPEVFFLYAHGALGLSALPCGVTDVTFL